MITTDDIFLSRAKKLIMCRQAYFEVFLTFIGYSLLVLTALDSELFHPVLLIQCLVGTTRLVSFKGITYQTILEHKVLCPSRHVQASLTGNYHIIQDVLATKETRKVAVLKRTALLSIFVFFRCFEVRFAARSFVQAGQ